MKTILATAALAIAIATPAFAQDQWAYEVAPNQAYAQETFQGYAQAPWDAYAASDLSYVRRPHSPNPAWDVYDSLGYVGSDPDPFIRNSLARDGRSED